MKTYKPAVISLSIGLLLSATAWAQTDNTTTLPSPPLGTESTTKDKLGAQGSTTDNKSTSAPIDPKNQTLSIDQEGDNKGIAGGLKFGDMDINGNGSLNQTEMAGQASLKGKFKSMDKDSDGKVSQSEFSAFTAANKDGASATVKASPEADKDKTDKKDSKTGK